MARKRVLITGAAGYLSRQLLPVFRERYDLVLLDRRKPDDIDDIIEVEPEQLLSFIEETKKRGIWVPIVAGIWPLVSHRNAEFLANEVPGVTVPAHVIERMRRANEKSKEHGGQEGIAIAREMLERVETSP